MARKSRHDSTPIRSRMRPSAITLLAASLVLSLPLTAYGAETSPAPPTSSAQSVSNPQQSSAFYQIKATLDEAKGKLHGQEKVVFRNETGDSLDRIVFHTYADANRSLSTQSELFVSANEEMRERLKDKKAAEFLGGMVINAVQVDGSSAAFTHQNQSLSLSLKQPLKPGESVELQIDFVTGIPYGTQRLSRSEGLISGAHAFPTLSVYNASSKTWDAGPYSRTFESDHYEAADYQVELEVSANTVVAMPGVLTERVIDNGTRKIVSASAERTREFVFFASPSFTVERETRNGLTVEYYVLGSDVSKREAAKRYIDQAFKAIDFFGQKYGAYPYPEFRIVESNVQGVAVEYSRLIQMGRLNVEADAARHSAFVHEIAHQWFHSLIGNDSEHESFLDEGFADFSTAYFYEKQGDTESGFDPIRFDDFPSEHAIAETNDQVGDAANEVYYAKGRQAIYQLYRSVGESRFDAMMQEYFRRYEYRNATIKGLIDTISDTLGQSVAQTFSDALYKPGFVLDSKYAFSEAERKAYLRKQFEGIYTSIFDSRSDIPFTSMNRLVREGLRGEPLYLVIGDSANPKALAERANQIKATLDIQGVNTRIISGREAIRTGLKKELASSNLILLGDSRSHAVVQALKPMILKQAASLGLDWDRFVARPGTTGAYIIRHPYNHNKLILHVYEDDVRSTRMARDAAILRVLDALGFSSDFKQFFAFDSTGQLLTEHRKKNSLSELFPSS
ncbi:hypothetical protein B9G55_05970 [Saccharibacillus sp. O16]|nr:hypothetical protein B9G55_05970 [Saccharibacillus sp. O16]